MFLLVTAPFSRTFGGPPVAIITIDKSKLLPSGEYYLVEVPNTLDLADLAAISINCLTGNVDPVRAYSVYQVFSFSGPPKCGGITWNLPAKNARALPWLRTMSGSDQGLDTECGIMRALVSSVQPDGMAYFPVEGEGAPKGTSYPFVNGLIAMAALNWQQRDHNKSWLEFVSLVCKGLKTSVIRVEDRAYYPPECGRRPDGTWLWTLRGQPQVPYIPPAEPSLEQQGLEGCVKYEQAMPIRVLVKSFQIYQDREALQTARRLLAFYLKPGMWEDTSAEGYLGNEHGVFGGHFHGNTAALTAILDLALVTDDSRLKQLVREGYDHARRTGVIRMGWFPGHASVRALKRPMSDAAETCGVSDMLILAVKLTHAGIGDYWDDVDSIVRNHLTVQQFTDPARMSQYAGISPQTSDPLIRRFQGGFGQGRVTDSDPALFGCCSANGAVALYYAWHGITQFHDGIATVNLFLNRASPWVDVDSYLPYEGKLRLHNKKARTVQVRLPYWIQRESVKCRVDGKPARPQSVGRYLIFENLHPESAVGKEIALEFGVPGSVEKHTMAGKQYTLTFRGSTLVDISPRSTDPAKWQYYRREEMRAGKAVMHGVRRFVADKMLELQ
jgi:hypothetical protein